ncbi:Lysozyme RrrD [compost metagenome]
MQPLKSRLSLLGASAVIAGAGAFLGPIESGPKGPQLTPYADMGGVPTWCYGETLGTPRERYTVQQCDMILLKSVQRHWAGIEFYVPVEAPLSVKEAMLSVAYNVGVQGWIHPVFLKPLANKDWQGTCAAITAPWKGKLGIAKGFKATVQGKPARGLENRRAKEYALCMRDL